MEYFLAIILFIVILDTSSPKTELILLDNNSTKNSIIVQKGEEKRVIDKPYDYVTINNLSGGISETKQASKEDIEKKYGSIIHKKFVPPTSLLYYFQTGQTTLTQQSKKDLEKLIPQIKQHYPCNVTIIGHSDRQGDDEINMKLSLKRAQSIYEWLIKQDVKINSLDIKSYGEKDPIIPTADGVAEPKNRRVEVLIR